LSFRLADLAEKIGGELQGDPRRQIEGIRGLDTAGPSDLSFLANPRYRKSAAFSRAGALLVSPSAADLEGPDLLIVADPYFALAELLDIVYPRADHFEGVHESAVVGEGATIDATASLGPFSVIGDRSRIGPDVEIHSHVVVGRDCVIGSGSVLYPGVVIYDGVEIGERCRLHSGVVIGSDGFGYAQHDGQHVKLKHVGRVVVEDDVEIGANTAVDRALLDETRIGAGSKVDNLVQIGHNVTLGRGCLLVAQAGISGSTRLGDGVIVAGQSGLSGHLKLGDGVQVAAKSAVFKSVEAGKKVAGIPATDASSWLRQQAMVARLVELGRRIANLERSSGSPGKQENES
jgi:UDP-3-O-[3-hydroxymyristoyl] glucosamine N-acyltransferase